MYDQEQINVMHSVMSCLMKQYGTRKGIDKIYANEDGTLTAYISESSLIEYLPEMYCGCKISYIVDTPTFKGLGSNGYL